jgi:hypothetical protein
MKQQVLKVLGVALVMAQLVAGRADPLDRWQQRNAFTVSSFVESTIFADGQFLALGERAVATSPDGTNWTTYNCGPVDTAGTTYGLGSVAYGNGTFVAVGDGQTPGSDGSCGVVFTSTDGVNWAPHIAPLYLAGFNNVVFGNGMFVAPCLASDPTAGTYIVTSSDGIQWTPVLNTTAEEGTLSYANGRFFLPPGFGNWLGEKFLTSTDGIHWDTEKEDTEFGHSGVVYANGTFVLVADREILASRDGLTWTNQLNDLNISLDSVSYGGGMLVAVGDDGLILSSPDGQKWTRRASGTSETLLQVTYGNGTFVTVGEGGTILQSGQLAGTLLTLGPVTPLANGTVAVTVNGALGDTWQIQDSTNLVDWAPLTNVTITNVPMQFLDQGAANLSRRFYRGFNPD